MLIKDVKKLSPTERMLYWIREREHIRLAKELGEPAPWSNDMILQNYRFTNVRRMDDKVSQWLWHNWYKPNFDHPKMIQIAALARFINLPSSLEAIHELVFVSNPNRPSWPQIKFKLRKLKEQGTIFNGAYMVRGNDGQDKGASVVDFYVKGLELVTADTDLMEETHSRLQACYGMGSFMAGQVVADLRWAMSGRWLDRNDWAPIGPGSKRGMNRLHGRAINTPLNQMTFLIELREFIQECEDNLPDSITSRLEAMDYQNCCCEFDKYCRVLLEEGKSPKQRYPGAANVSS